MKRGEEPDLPIKNRSRNPATATRIFVSFSSTKHHRSNPTLCRISSKTKGRVPNFPLVMKSPLSNDNFSRPEVGMCGNYK